MELTADTPQQITVLYRTYLSLSLYEQTLLKLLALVHRPLGVTKLNKLLTLVKQSGLIEDTASVVDLTAEHRGTLVAKALIAHSQYGVSLNILLRNRLTEACIEDNTYNKIVHILETFAPLRRKYEWQRDALDNQCIAREHYFFDEFDSLEQHLAANKNPQIIHPKENQFFIELCFIPFNLPRFLQLPGSIQYHSFASWFAVRRKVGSCDQYLLELLETVCESDCDNNNLRHLLAETYLYHLRLDDFKHVCEPGDKSCYGLQLNAARLFLEGGFDKSQQLFELAMVAKNKYGRRKYSFLGGPLGLFYKFCLLALAGQQGAHYYSVALDQLRYEATSKDTPVEFAYVCEALAAIITKLSGGKDSNVNCDKYLLRASADPLCYHLILLISLLGEIWLGRTLSGDNKKVLKQCDDFFRCPGFALFARICRQISATDKQKSTKTPKSIGPEYSDTVNFPQLVSPKAEWDIALERLIALNPELSLTQQPTNAVRKPVRIVWEAEVGRESARFKAREQKQSAKGWTKGRPISLKRLAEETASFSYFSEADKKMCGAIVAYQNYGYYSSVDYELEGTDALIAAKDLDNVFLVDDLSAPIEFSQKEPELLISQQGKQLHLSIADLPRRFGARDEHQACSITETAPERYSFTLFTASHLKVAEIVGEGGLVIPLHAKTKVLESVAAIAPLLNIQSDLDEIDTGLETLPCDKHLVINIQPSNAGLEFTCMVMPFGEHGPAFKPCLGNANLTAELEAKRVATQRDLMHESVLLDALDRHCPQFLTMTDNSLAVDDLQAALDVLEQLEQVVSQQPPPFALRLRWPKGKKFNLGKRLESQHLQLAVGKNNEWFDLNGKLAVDEHQVIELKKLLELISASSGRFVQLDAGQVLALSQDLRQKLERINQVTDDGKFHPLASLQVAEATTGMRMKTIDAWQQQTQKMHESNALDFKVPPTLQANLRDYQQAGFDWMCRLAHWGAGACLADDMGLGKTLQALAVLLFRAKGGPSLVVAPTSVCFNWQQEALKFAPTLKVKLFSDFTNVKLRTQLLSRVAALDCVVVSYGLLQRESELLAGVNWHTIVADEAQALKNPLAKRTQAACRLKGDFKIITTGTPIENNLAELWSLFRFVNPGLLGSLKGFGQRYALPIENVKHDKLAARKASLGLKTLIQPFILRRMKNQVLTELPSRTEINIQVELSSKEQAFYEALRQNAIANISKPDKTLNAGAQRIRMLAELVKLRQACCNPKLIMAETDLPSAKLTALDELLDELQRNNHKALIFSQFVGHLQLIKQHLDNRKVNYQYLDGSTPQKERAKRVNAFQSGSGQVFLISLKAGGSGLNLTAADYVIHMDPWWNPAVEDQASDRAHRMGQQRPVTIYRLIAKSTIEEKIVALHQHKRDLADKLLAGNEQASKLSVDDMLNMLKETF